MARTASAAARGAAFAHLSRLCKTTVCTAVQAKHHSSERSGREASAARPAMPKGCGTG